MAPGLFGDMTHQAYWGRYYLWEMSLFIGVTGTAMVVYGGLAGGPRRQWRAVALPGSSQERDELMPANYVLRAVPLAAGRLRVKYVPAVCTIGTWVSAVVRIGFGIAGAVCVRMQRVQ